MNTSRWIHRAAAGIAADNTPTITLGVVGVGKRPTGALGLARQSADPRGGGRRGGARRRPRSTRLGRMGVALAGALLLAGATGHASPAHAASSVVGDGTPGSCTKAALDTAVANGGTVTFNCGGSPVTIVDNLTISQDTSLDGTGQQITIDGGGAGQQNNPAGGPGSVITVNSPPPPVVAGPIGQPANSVHLTLTALTLTHGDSILPNGGGGINNQGGTVSLINSTVSDNTSTAIGGGIDNEFGTVTLTNSTVSGNLTYSYGAIANNGGTVTLTNSTVSGNIGTRGAGIWNANGGTVTLTNSTVSGNTAGQFSGGIWNANGGTMTLTNSTVSGNTAGGSDNYGGGILNDGTMTLTNSTVSGNFAAIGGGILNDGTMTLTNSTVSGNTAGDGGGIGNFDMATVTLTNSTVSGNTAYNYGGGILNDGTMTLRGAILAGNIIRAGSSAPVGPDCSGALASDGYNLLGDNSGCTGLTNGTNGDQVGGTDPGGNGSVIDPKLGPLQNNGGPTATQALLTGSPAIDVIPQADLVDQNNQPLTTDQRGLPRPDAGESLGDIGAYEVQDPRVTAQSIAATEGAPFKGVVATVTDADPNATAAPLSATIAWGDGTTSPGTVTAPGTGGYSVSGSHAYAEDGSYQVTVTVTDQSGAMGSASATATVGDAALAATPVTVAPVEGAAFSGPVATFTDANAHAPLSDYSAVITWGDGTTSAGTVSGSNGAYSVSGSHTYAEQGSYPVKVTITDAGGSTTSASSTASVSDPAVTATGAPVAATEGQASGSQTVATFTDPGGAEPVGDYSATVDWGDGTTSAGVISANGAGGFSVSGAHTYAEEGRYTVTTTVHHEGAPDAVATSTATVADAALIVTQSAAGGQPNRYAAIGATFTDADPQGKVSDYTATINWGDGTTSAGSVATNPLGPGFAAGDVHRYARGGTYTVTLTIGDSGDGSVTVTKTVSTR